MTGSRPHHLRARSWRVALGGCVLLLVGVGVGVVRWRADPGAGVVAPAAVGRVVAPGPASSPLTRALALLRRWDADRAAAYVSGDAVALRGLYTPRSRAAAGDLALLASYVERGLRVRDLRTQVLAARLLASGPRRVVVRVVDRVAGGVVEPQVAGRLADPTWARPVPTGPARTREVTLVRPTGGAWRVAGVRTPG